MIDPYRLLRPLLFALPAETAHTLTLHTLRVAHRIGLLRAPQPISNPISVMGLCFHNRLGIAAGFDKNGIVVDALSNIGFGFVEVGTVTPRAQPGQLKPRLFRLIEDAALINRMGFPNDGAMRVAERLRTHQRICGINVGKNAITSLVDAQNDYVDCLKRVYSVADYVAVNVSSPNTVDLRKLQTRDHLLPLIESLLRTRVALTAHTGRTVPLLIKLTVDLELEQLIDVSRAAIDAGLDGIIVSNTTLKRCELRARHRNESGGLSGVPLFKLALESVRGIRAAIGTKPVIIGVGGIASAADAIAMRTAGADLLQIYSALVYRGPQLISELTQALAE